VPQGCDWLSPFYIEQRDFVIGRNPKRVRMRSEPNVIVAGTPGVGKTSHCEYLLQDTKLKHLAINKVAEDRGCIDSRDDELGCWVVDEEKVSHGPSDCNVQN
jgi:hypothetical protein